MFKEIFSVSKIAKKYDKYIMRKEYLEEAIKERRKELMQMLTKTLSNVPPSKTNKKVDSVGDAVQRLDSDKELKILKLDLKRIENHLKLFWRLFDNCITSENEREAIKLKITTKLSTPQIAMKLNISEHTVNVAYTKGLKKMKMFYSTLEQTKKRAKEDANKYTNEQLNELINA